jgi:O-antigen ligase
MGRRLEYLFAGVGLFLTSSALFPLLSGAGDSTLVAPPADKRLTLASLAVYGIAGFLVFRRGERVAELVRGNRFLFALIGLALLSGAWSAVPGSTEWKAVAVLLTTVLGVYLATSFSVSELAVVLSWTLLALLAGSILFAKFAPGYGLDHIRGDAWRGLFTTKNELGRIAVLSAAVWLVRLLTGSGRRFVAVAGLGISLYTLDKSGSKTGLLVIGLLAVFLAALPALRAHSSIAIPAAFALGIAGVLSFPSIAAHSDSVLNSVGGDSTLTGRSAIWAAVWTMIKAHPWLGYGFGAFWRGFDGPSGQVWATIGATPPHSHNGALDLWLDLGFAGIVLAAGSLLVAGARAARALRGEWSIESVFPAVMIVFLLLFNLTESSFLKQHSMFWVLYVATAVGLARRPQEEPVAVFEPVVVPA